MLTSILLAGFLIQPLSEEELTRQLVYSALHFVDYRQTLNISSTLGLEEKNRILGPRPSRGRTTGYFATTLVAHWAITYSLPPEHRKLWQQGTIVLELAVVGRNKQLGVSVNF